MNEIQQPTMTDHIGAVESKSAARQNTIYSPLDRDKWEIRIARVVVGDGELVHVYLEVMSFHNPCKAKHCPIIG